MVNLAAVEGKDLVVECARLPGTVAGTVELLAETALVLAEIDDVAERASVQWHTENNLAGTSNVCLKVVDGLLGIEWREFLCNAVPAVGGLGVGGAGVHIALVTGEVGEAATLVVEGHQVPVVDVLVHLLNAQDVVARGSSGRGNTQIKMVAMGVCGRILVIGLDY